MSRYQVGQGHVLCLDEKFVNRGRFFRMENRPPATIKCSKGLEIARRAKYNITGTDTSLDEIIRYLRKGISAYSITFHSKNNTPRYFDVRKYREVIPEVLAKHNCTPDDFTSEFVRLLKELL